MIPGVGKHIAEDLWNLGIRKIQDLEGQDPRSLYTRLCMQEGKQVDTCLLPVFRCAVYFASEIRLNPKYMEWMSLEEF